MFRGTTPTHTFSMPKELAEQSLQALYITYYQDGKVILEKGLDDVIIAGENIKVTLTQSETLKFKSGHKVSIQIRLKTDDEKAFASRIIKCDVDAILKEGVI